MEHSKFIVYVDESGTPNLAADPDYPIFVLSCCVFEKKSYAEFVVPEFLKLKFNWFDDDYIILRNQDITLRKKDFGFLGYDNLRNKFMAQLSDLMEKTPVTLVAAVIDKRAYTEKSKQSMVDVYGLALKFCMERIYMYLQSIKALGGKTVFVVESRGDKEDTALELAFRRNQTECMITGGMPNFAIKFVSKKANSTGLQIADLMGTPIGHRILSPEQKNRAWDILQTKFYRTKDGKLDGVGLKVFPKQRKSEVSVKPTPHSDRDDSQS